jgi:hypothetical protein
MSILIQNQKANNEKAFSSLARAGQEILNKYEKNIGSK